MIVTMKKIFLVTLESHKEQALDRLRDIGVMHIELAEAHNEMIAELKEKRNILNKALGALPQPENPVTGKKNKDVAPAIRIAEEINNLFQREAECMDEIKRLQLEIDKFKEWGDFNKDDIASLRERGIAIRLFDVTKEQLEDFSEGVYPFVVHKTKARIKVAAVVLGDDHIPFVEIPLPERSLSQLNKQIQQRETEIKHVREKLEGHSKDAPLMQRGVEQLEEQIEFEQARASLTGEGALAYITGYVPQRDTEKLKKGASRHNWGIMITDPGDHDNVPTLVENPKWIRPIMPIFNLLGTIPGYKEYDISPWFLIFFSIFWAMIVGDAGYGLIFLLATITARAIFRKAPREPFLLLFITGIATVLWGGVTGTWFGIEALSRHPALSWMIIPSVASFSLSMEGGTGKIIMHICFIIGAVHLSTAHLINFFKLLPSLRSYAEIGRLSMIWGLYFLIRNLVLKIELHPASLWLLGLGFGMVIVFTNQNGSFIRGVVRGFSNLIIIILGSIGFFSDVVSYVRLFAVGLATLEVAKSFNAMASGFGSGIFSVLGAVFILFFGHALNIILCSMSLIVHGIRLNMLEFSGHLCMEWSGFKYRPFKKSG